MMVIYTRTHNRNYYTIIIILFFQFVQYSPQEVFGDFARELCDKRRRGDADDSYKCEAAAAKGVGVSINTCLLSSSSSSFVFNRIKQCKKKCFLIESNYSTKKSCQRLTNIFKRLSGIFSFLFLQKCYPTTESNYSTKKVVSG